MMLDILLILLRLTHRTNSNQVQFSPQGRARLSVISSVFLEDLYPVVPTVDHNNVALLCYSDTTGIFKAAFILTKRTKCTYEFAISIKHLNSVVVIIAHQDVVFVVAGHALGTVKQTVL